MLLKENFALINRLIELNSLLIMSQDSMTNEQRFEANMIKARMDRKNRDSKTRRGGVIIQDKDTLLERMDSNKGAAT